MKNFLLKTWLTMLCLLVGVGTSWAETKTEGFENATAGTDYQKTQTYTSENSDCGIGWEIYYGTVSTSSKITGNNSAAIRLYTSDNYGYLKTTTPIDGLTQVSFDAKAATSNEASIKINVCSSVDGNSWSIINADVSPSTTAGTYTYAFQEGHKYFKIEVSSNSKKPSKSSAQLTIDNVIFKYTSSGTPTNPTTYTITIANNIANGTVTASPTSAEEGKDITLTATPDDGYEFGSWNVMNASTGEAITVTNNQFKMPAANVNVSAFFNKIQDGESGNGEETESKIIINVHSITNPHPNTSITYSTYNWTSGSVSGVYNGASSTNNTYLQFNYSTTSTSNYRDKQAVYNSVAIPGRITSIKMVTSSSGTIRKWTPYISDSPITPDNYKNAQALPELTVQKESEPNHGTTWNVTGNAKYFYLNYTVGNASYIDEIVITYVPDSNTPDTPDPSKHISSINITGTPEIFWKSDAFNHNGITVTATYDDESTEDVTNAAIFTGYDMSTAGKQTVTVTYQEQSATYDIEVKTIANTEATAYTTAEAIELIEVGKDLLTDVYVKGTISKVDKFNGTYKSITYWLDNNTFEVYGGLAKEGEEFTSIDDIEVGAKVVVLGKIKKYNGTYELDQNNHLVSYEVTQPETKEYTVTYYVNGVPTTETVLEGANLSQYPTEVSALANNKVFTGWVKTVTVDANNKPAYVDLTKEVITEDVNYFAVFATKTTTGDGSVSDEWVKVPHNVNEDWTAEGNEYVLVYEDKSENKIFYADKETNYEKCAISNDKITKIFGNYSIIQINHPSASSTDLGLMITNGDHANYYIHNNKTTSAFSGKMVLDKLTDDNLKGNISKTYTTIKLTSDNKWEIKVASSWLAFATADFRFRSSEIANIEFYKRTKATTTTYSDFTTNMDEVSIAEACVDSKSGLHYGTYSNEKAFVVPSNMTVAVVGIKETEKTLIVESLEKGKAVPANTGVMISSEDFGNHYFAYAIDETVATLPITNYLYPSSKPMEEVEGDNLFYKLTMHNGTQIGFWWGAENGAAFKMGANKAYLAVPKAVANSIKSSMWVDEEGTLTEIDNIEFTPADNTIYNLQGQRINRADKGVYIVNGRKVIR